jgi:ABC-type glycerol-3-phosphate transport system substrate-binding protein
MSRTARILAASAALLAVAAGAAIAQDFSANPTYATLNLTTGFQPDPNVVNVQSGGNINAQNLNSSCQGFIANAPDVRVNYTAGNQYPLIISVAAQADTTLVVNGPDGQWYCDDDGGVNGLNPAIRFNHPSSGQYDVWIGTYGSSNLQPAQLNVSEVSSQ